jgi:hypothetical protein
MRDGKTDKLPWRYDFGFLPGSRKMSLIGGHNPPRSVGAFQEYFVLRINRCFEAPGRNHRMTMVLDDLQQLQPKTLSDPELGTGKHVVVFLKDGMRNIQVGRLRNSNQENSAMQPGRLYYSRNQNICIDHQTERKHCYLDFRDRAFLIILSISREFNALVLFRSDSSPRILKTSGSGAASLT